MVDNTKVLKSGIWYTAANFIVKAIGFLTTPFFTRLLSHEEFGLYSNYASWLSTLTIFMTLGLGTTFISAKFDFKDEFDQYISSTLVLSSVVTVFWGLIIICFHSFVSSFTGIETKYLFVLIIYLLLYSAVDMYQAKERYLFGYQKSVITSLAIAISTAALSVVLVYLLKDRLAGRIYGSALPTICIGIFLYILLITSGKMVNVRYWKYALPICLPFIPHVLSLTLLNSMDKVMITKICGAEENALYSLAYSCGAIITLLASSINLAFSPWLGEKLNKKLYDDIYSVSIKYVLLFAAGACGIMLITPEILLIMGGKGYTDAIFVMPPVSFGCVCQFIYSMYVSVEQFNKKTVGMAIASCIAALSNYFLNMMFIPKYGYIAAAYTTLASYLILLMIHVLLVNRLKLGKIYPLRFFLLLLLFMTVYTIAINYLYRYNIIRYCLIAAYFTATVVFAVKYKKWILALFKKERN